MTPKRVFLVAFLFTAATPVDRSAAYDWGLQGLPIGSAPGLQATGSARGSGLAAPDGAGGAYVAWFDERTLPSRIFLQRVTVTGTPASGWPANGIPVSAATPTSQSGPALADDGSGGALIAWAEGSYDSVLWRLRAIRVTSQGTPSVGWPAAGVVVTDSAGAPSLPEVVPDGAGGVFVLWRRPASFSYVDRVYLHHVRADGTLDPAWPGDGRVVGYSQGPLTAAVRPDGAGGALVLWDDRRWPENVTDIRLARIQANGSLAPDWPTLGLVIRSTTTLYDNVRGPTLAPDGTGGAVVAFREFKTPAGHSGLYAKRVLGNGQFAPGWADSGAVAAAPTGVAQIRAVTDGQGGVILAWEALANGFPGWDIWVQRLNALGSVAAGWPADGRPAGIPQGNALEPVLVPDQEGGAFVGWVGYHEDRGRGYLQHVTQSGANASGWGAGGAELAPGRPIDHDQSAPALAPGIQSSIFAFWTDGPIPAGDLTDVRGQYIAPAPTGGVHGPLDPRQLALSVHPTPAISVAHVEFRLPRSASVSVGIFDIAGRRVRTLMPLGPRAPGVYAPVWDLRGDRGEPMAPGVYRIVLRAEGVMTTTSAVVLR